MPKAEDNVDDLQDVSVAMERAGEYKLENEVVLFALYHAQSHPNDSISQCLAAGLAEWDC